MSDRRKLWTPNKWRRHQVYEHEPDTASHVSLRVQKVGTGQSQRAATFGLGDGLSDARNGGRDAAALPDDVVLMLPATELETFKLAVAGKPAAAPVAGTVIVEAPAGLPSSVDAGMLEVSRREESNSNDQGEKHPIDPLVRRGWRAPRWTATVVMLVVIVLANVLLEVFRRPFDVLGARFPESAIVRVNRCESLGAVPDVLFLGSSLTMHGISPSAVDAASTAAGHRILSCNVGTDASTFEEDYYVLKRMVEDGYAPKMVVETLWEYNVDARGDPPADSYSTPIYESETVADPSDLSTLRAHFGSGLSGKLQEVGFVADKLIPMLGARVGIFRAICGPLQVGPCQTPTSSSTVASSIASLVLASDRYGWSALVGRSDADWTAAQRAEYGRCYATCKHFAIGGHQMNYLAKLVALAQARGIGVALVVPPVSQYNFFNLYYADDWTQLMAYWQTFAIDNHAAFFDESHSPAYTDADFWDIHHLDSAGATKFSAWIGSTLLPQMWQ